MTKKSKKIVYNLVPKSDNKNQNSKRIVFLNFLLKCHINSMQKKLG